MVEDKYIGLALAISGTLAIGSSFIITKKVSVDLLCVYSGPKQLLSVTDFTLCFMLRRDLTTLDEPLNMKMLQTTWRT